MKLHNLNTRKNFRIKNLCLCIGNFDGVHLGHQHLIKKIIKNAKLNQLRSAILTFVPHPKIYFNRTSDNFNIIKNDDKKKLLNLLGVEHYIEYKFNKLLSSLNPKSFIEKINNLENIILTKDDYLFHAGTMLKENKWLSNGGRVLNISNTDKDLKTIRENIHNIINQINWDEGYYRKDIGWRYINE